MAIFKKSDDQETYAAEPAPKIEPKSASRSSNVSVIGPTMVFKGELAADEDLIIEGLVEGTIAHHNKHLTVGQKGRVKADIHANSVIVLGQLVGDIHSKGMVSLAKGSDVVGNIYCARVAMEDGAKFKGKVDMGEARKTVSKAAPGDRDNTEKLRSVPMPVEKAGG